MELRVGARVRARYLGRWVCGVVVGEALEGGWLVGENRNLEDVRAFYPCDLEVLAGSSGSGEQVYDRSPSGSVHRHVAAPIVNVHDDGAGPTGPAGP